MRSLHFFCNQLIPGMFNSLSTNVPLIDKPDSWFLLGKCLKNTCGRVSSTCIFTKNVTLPQVFLKHFASKNQLPGFYISRTFVKIITVSNLNYVIWGLRWLFWLELFWKHLSQTHFDIIMIMLK